MLLASTFDDEGHQITPPSTVDYDTLVMSRLARPLSDGSERGNLSDPVSEHEHAALGRFTPQDAS